MLAGADERTPLKQQPKHNTAFADNRWLLVLLISTLFMGLTGLLLDKRHSWNRQLQSDKEKVAKAPELQVIASLNAKPKQVHAKPGVDTTEYFLKCNPSVTPLESVSVRGGGAFEKGRSKTPLDGDRCSSEEVAVIRGMLDTNKYIYEATVPDPYLYPANVLEALLAMDIQTLRFAIVNYEKRASKMGNLGSLVKLFAWGLPLHAKELWGAAGGDDVIEAMTRCNVIRKCGSTSVYTSNVQLFAVQDTSIVVATDWPVPGLLLRKDENPVQAIDQSTLSLTRNMPDAQGKRAVDLVSNGGVLGLMAAEKGAEDVRIIQQNRRGMQFTKFNMWLNLVSKQVQVYQNSLEETELARYELVKAIGKEPDVYLVMTHPQGPLKDDILRTTFTITRRLLSPKGSLVMALEDQHCESFSKDYRNQLCSEDATGAPIGLAGSIVCKSTVATHAGSGGDDDSQEGIVYGWQALWAKEETFKENNRMCGDFQVYHLPKFDSTQGPEACRYARAEMMCSQSEYKTANVLDEILGADI